jgi:hypothetical protein
MSIKTKPKLKTQVEADVVLHLLAIGCGADSWVREYDVFPGNDPIDAINRGLLIKLAKTFRCRSTIDARHTMGWVITLNQELFDAYDEWVDTHQED